MLTPGLPRPVVPLRWFGVRKFPSSHVALATGASLGIGAAIAREFARHGSSVAVHFNASEEQAHEVVVSIEAGGGRAAALQVDLAQPDQCRRLADAALQRFGRIDALVNNAGSLVGRRRSHEIDKAVWASVLDLNLGSVLWVTQAVAPHMRERGSGSIVNLGSIAYHNGGGPGAMPYAAAKAAVTGITKGLAKEVIRDGIRVNAVNPGVFGRPSMSGFRAPTACGRWWRRSRRDGPGKRERLRG